ncbi:hypothetical protein IMAU20120_01331 [Lactiplantibacillus plantarum]|nr:hypothetical protein [Lactiplantibacillus plantarum]MCG0592599.1 hypothetical protein [Lactiplantibacillus plantarum]MCG0664286.1 hypothetical protein [Lactiplantibacillus plantarum]MCG0671162.1 hypothetical protein [Lactiplantibacillus plantarum]MCG0812320.1 hypothetical protein [Lactiplantibacillus plantarum]MCG0873357.1 hypothetical protein [Lactiplantibacillus plantarum]
MVEKKHLIIRNGATLRRLAEKPNNSFSPEKPLRNMEDSMDFLASEMVDCKFNPNFWTNLSA